MASPRHERASLGNAIRWHPDDHEAIAAARSDLSEAVIRREVDRAPHLSPEGRIRLAVMLLAPATGNGDEAA